MAEKTPEELRDELLEDLVEQKRYVDSMEAWFNGAHPLPAADATNSDLYRRFQKMAQANYLGQVVNAVNSRMSVDGVRFGDAAADEDAWAMWQRSHMDASQTMLLETALVTGIAYISVWPSETEPGEVDWSPEHPSEVVHEMKPGSLRTVASALKVYEDDDAWIATLWTPGYISQWSATGDWDAWTLWTLISEDANPFGQVPMIPLTNKPTLRGGWSSEMSDGIPIQKRINQTLLNMLVAEEAVAFPQRWATGLEVKKNADGTATRPFRSGADALWVSEDEGTRFGQFSESDFAGYLGAIGSDVEMLAAVTATPMFAMSAKLSVPPSAEALTAMESSLVKKVQARERVFGEAIEDAFRLAFKMKNDPRAEVQDAEVIWADPNIQSLAAIGDFVTKAASVGVPQAALWEKLGASPQEIARWEAQSMSEAFKRLVMQVGAQQQAAPQDGEQQQMNGAVQPPMPGL
jgi:hypothetical protein